MSSEEAKQKKAEYARRWRAAHPNYVKEWRARHPERAAEIDARKREKHKKWQVEYNKQYRIEHHEELVAYYRQWRSIYEATHGTSYGVDDYAKNRLRFRENHMRKTYRLSLDGYKAMLSAQGGLCAICGQPETAKDRGGNLKFMSVDHDHVTGEIRGLLCNACNVGLGRFKEDVALLRSAIAYLEKYARHGLLGLME